MEFCSVAHSRRLLDDMHMNPLDLWNTVAAFPLVPFRHGKLDLEGYAKNLRYLMSHNWLDGGRKRVIAFGGSSLIHHIDTQDQFELMRLASEAAGDRSLLLSGIVPNPLGAAAHLIERQSLFARPPDAYLILPVNGVANPEGIYRTLKHFCDDMAGRFGARFLLYLRNSNQREALGRLTKDCRSVLGVKVGTTPEDVSVLADLIGEEGIVMWGVGDRATAAFEHGARGHTSGIAQLFPKASDLINNASRAGDLEACRRVEADIDRFEQIRFMSDRAFNYSALVAAAQLAGFEDVEGGDGGPFNALPAPEVTAMVAEEVEKLRHYHD
jgi:dihydrodipicolinate synthase/N-acetylneuraminate lyase